LIVDNKGKLFGKINLVDFAFLLFILLAFLGGIYRFFIAGSKVQVSVPESITYTVSLNGVRQVSADAINEGDKVFFEPSNQLMGTIVKKVVEPSRGNVVKTNGDVVESIIPGKFNVTMTINIQTGTDPVETANVKNKLIIGNNMYLKTRMLLFGVTVTGVEIEQIQ